MLAYWVPPEGINSRKCSITYFSLQDHQEELRSLFANLIKQEQCKWNLFYSLWGYFLIYCNSVVRWHTFSAEVDDLKQGFELVKCFSKSASESLTVMLGSCSRYLSYYYSSTSMNYVSFQWWCVPIYEKTVFKAWQWMQPIYVLDERYEAVWTCS